MFAYAVDYLLADVDHLHGQRESEIAFDQFGYQGVARLVALFDGCALLNLRGAACGVDLAAQPDGHGHLSAYEAQTAVLYLKKPVGTQNRVDELLDRRDVLGRHHAAAEHLARKILHRAFHFVEVESDVFGHVGISARDADLGHAQTDGRAAFLLGGPFFVFCCLHGRIVGQRDGDRFVERQRGGRLLGRCLCEKQKRGCRDEGLDCYFHSVH